MTAPPSKLTGLMAACVDLQLAGAIRPGRPPEELRDLLTFQSVLNQPRLPPTTTALLSLPRCLATSHPRGDSLCESGIYMETRTAHLEIKRRGRANGRPTASERILGTKMAAEGGTEEDGSFRVSETKGRGRLARQLLAMSAGALESQAFRKSSRSTGGNNDQLTTS